MKVAATVTGFIVGLIAALLIVILFPIPFPPDTYIVIVGGVSFLYGALMGFVLVNVGLLIGHIIDSRRMES